MHICCSAQEEIPDFVRVCKSGSSVHLARAATWRGTTE